MKPKGKMAWLITWEGPGSGDNGRCKIVTILRVQFGGRKIAHLLPILFSSEYNYTLCEKRGFGGSVYRDPYFREAYRDMKPELHYGDLKIYLCARQVKNLRCEESKTDCLESTLYWTELPKYILNPNFKPEDRLPDNPADLLKQVSGERDVQYTYSIRPAIELEKSRRAKRLAESDLK